MPPKIDLSNPTFALEGKVAEVCQPFLKQFGFNYFQYARLFHDGSIACLLSDASLTKHLMELDLTSYSSVKDQQSYWFLWDEELPEFPVKIAKEAHNLHHGLTLLRRHKTHYDMIAVAMPNVSINASSFYFNHLKTIEHFIFEFETQNQDLLKVTFGHKMELPQKNWDPNLQQLLLLKNRIPIPQLGTYITLQESSCLRLSTKGLSHKEIARVLNISPRSVETYLSRLKHRTECNDLHYLLSLCQ